MRSIALIRIPALRLAFFVVSVMGLLAVASLATAQVPIAAPPHACDALAANTLDPDRVGPGVETRSIDVRRALPACEAAVDLFPSELRFQFQLGRVYRRAGRYDEALVWYRAAAEAGYAGAQNSLGVMYSRGEGMAEDCDLAAYWIGLAAAQGSPAAINNLRVLRCVRAA